jgi:TolB-like protein/Flp pilus assembly protein TadD
MALLVDALRIIESTGERWLEAELYRHKGELLLRQGHHEAAEDLYRKALSIAREQEAKLWELRAATSLAQLWGDQGRREEARDLLAPVYSWFTEGFDTPDLMRAADCLGCHDSGVAQTQIRTFAGKGVRFVAEVTRGATELGSRTSPVSKSDARSPPPLSIVVLPFTNLSNDPDQEYFADGITDDLTTDLSRISGSFVIARSTAFTYKEKAVDAKQVGRELGVRYVLEGSVRRSIDQVRVNTQLIDAETGAHLWAERFDRDIGDLFALQDQITSRIAVALNFELISVEATRPTKSPDALDYILRGRAALSKPPSPDSYAEAIRLFDQALALHPRSVDAQSWLATALENRLNSQMTGTREADSARSEGLIEQALAASPHDPQAHFAKGWALFRRGRPFEAIPEFETAISFNRNWAAALHGLGGSKLEVGSIDEAIPLVERAIRLSPRDPAIVAWYVLVGRVHLLQSRIDEAIVWLEKARSINPRFPRARVSLAAAYGLNGETERAAAELTEARKLNDGDSRFVSIASLKAARFWGVPKIRALLETTFFAGLRKAGLPEE